MTFKGIIHLLASIEGEFSTERNILKYAFFSIDDLFDINHKEVFRW